MSDIKKHILAVDLDGTLLNSEKQITYNSMKAINYFKENLGNVILCSGRSVNSTRWIAEVLNLNDPIISFNGSIIQDFDGTYLNRNIIDNFKFQNILHLAESLNIELIVYTESKMFIRQKTPMNKRWLSDILTLNGANKERENFYKSKTELVLGLLPWNLESVIKVVALPNENDRFAEFCCEIRKLNFELNITPRYIEITNYGFDKSDALELLGNKKSFSKNDVIAIGDNYNDLTMIKNAGLGIAMSNAKDQVKKHAKYITLSNDEDGVANAIYKYIEGEIYTNENINNYSYI